MNGKKAKALRREARAINGGGRTGHQTIFRGVKLMQRAELKADGTPQFMPVKCEQIVCVGCRAIYRALKKGYKLGEIAVAPDGDVTVTGKGRIGQVFQDA